MDETLYKMDMDGIINDTQQTSGGMVLLGIGLERFGSSRESARIWNRCGKKVSPKIFGNISPTTESY